jgi:acetyl-CoA carboxylase carboxyl transferase alpha subunit/acetyl-CoA carboxylase carboxyl transferase beta subunit
VKTLRDLLGRTEAGDEPPAEPAHEQCLSCGADLEGSRSYERYRVCHSCGFHFHLSARERIATLLDPASFHEDDRGVSAIDPISFQGRHGYRSRVISAQRRTGLTEAVLTGTGTIFGKEIVVAVVDFSFLGGSIGVAAGERLARAFEKAASRRAPIVTVWSTSGTRMQEGLLALLQLPRVMAAVQSQPGPHVPHIAVLADPTTGSAYAGYVNRADIIIAEPNALVGFAAMRVLQEQEGGGLAERAHTSEAHLERGLIDAVIDRPRLRDSVAQLLEMLRSEYEVSAAGRADGAVGAHLHKGAWRQVQLSRHERRPTARDLIARMTTTFVEIRGDRATGDDPSVVAGIGSLGGLPVVIVGQQRPHDAAGAQGWIGPAGFRKAERAFKLAGRLELPIVTLVDTAGAHPGIESEEGGLGHAISSCMATLLEARVSTVAVITGEGSSEAAVAMAVADRVLMLDNATYEVVRPEDAARILSAEGTGAEEVAERLRLTSHDCLSLGVIDGIVPEPGDGAHTDHAEAALLVRRSVLRALTQLQKARPKKRLEQRYERYRHVGSTRSRLRGRLERRLAHLTDRLSRAWARIRRRSDASRRRLDFGDERDIPI